MNVLPELKFVFTLLYQIKRVRTGSLNQVHLYSRGMLIPEHSYPLSHWPKCHGQRLTCPHKDPPAEYVSVCQRNVFMCFMGSDTSVTSKN